MRIPSKKSRLDSKKSPIESPTNMPHHAARCKQARQAAMMLRSLSSREGVIDCIVASPFLRCLQVFWVGLPKP